jgi:hypothetical protein
MTQKDEGMAVDYAQWFGTSRQSAGLSNKMVSHDLHFCPSDDELCLLWLARSHLLVSGKYIIIFIMKFLFSKMSADTRKR